MQTMQKVLKFLALLALPVAVFFSTRNHLDPSTSTAKQNRLVPQDKKALTMPASVGEASTQKHDINRVESVLQKDVAQSTVDSLILKGTAEAALAIDVAMEKRMQRQESQTGTESYDVAFDGVLSQKPKCESNTPQAVRSCSNVKWQYSETYANGPSNLIKFDRVVLSFASGPEDFCKTFYGTDEKKQCDYDSTQGSQCSPKGEKCEPLDKSAMVEGQIHSIRPCAGEAITVPPITQPWCGDVKVNPSGRQNKTQESERECAGKYSLGGYQCKYNFHDDINKHNCGNGNRCVPP